MKRIITIEEKDVIDSSEIKIRLNIGCTVSHIKRYKWTLREPITDGKGESCKIRLLLEKRKRPMVTEGFVMPDGKEIIL